MRVVTKLLLLVIALSLVSVVLFYFALMSDREAKGLVKENSQLNDEISQLNDVLSRVKSENRELAFFRRKHLLDEGLMGNVMRNVPDAIMYSELVDLGAGGDLDLAITKANQFLETYADSYFVDDVKMLMEEFSSRLEEGRRAEDRIRKITTYIGVKTNRTVSYDRDSRFIVFSGSEDIRFPVDRVRVNRYQFKSNKPLEKVFSVESDERVFEWRRKDSSVVYKKTDGAIISVLNGDGQDVIDAFHALTDNSVDIGWIDNVDVEVSLEGESPRRFLSRLYDYVVGVYKYSTKKLPYAYLATEHQEFPVAVCRDGSSYFFLFLGETPDGLYVVLDSYEVTFRDGEFNNPRSEGDYYIIEGDKLVVYSGEFGRAGVFSAWQ